MEVPDFEFVETIDFVQQRWSLEQVKMEVHSDPLHDMSFLFGYSLVEEVRVESGAEEAPYEKTRGMYAGDGVREG